MATDIFSNTPPESSKRVREHAPFASTAVSPSPSEVGAHTSTPRRRHEADRSVGSRVTARGEGGAISNAADLAILMTSYLMTSVSSDERAGAVVEQTRRGSMGTEFIIYYFESDSSVARRADVRIALVPPRE